MEMIANLLDESVCVPVRLKRAVLCAPYQADEINLRNYESPAMPHHVTLLPKIEQREQRPDVDRISSRSGQLDRKVGAIRRAITS